MRIDIWSDVICPWCYLGKRRLEGALERLAWSDEVQVRWRAYQLDPKATDEPRDLRAAMDRKYGPGAFDGMSRRLGALGQAEGIDYRFDRAVRVGTIDAHRLLAWAWDTTGAPGQGQLQERLFRAYFTEGANVADHATLRRLAAEAGLEAGAADQVLSSGAYADEVAHDLASAAERDLTGVPSFVIEDRFVVPGAQEVETLTLMLQRCRERFGSPTTG